MVVNLCLIATLTFIAASLGGCSSLVAGTFSSCAAMGVFLEYRDMTYLRQHVIRGNIQVQPLEQVFGEVRGKFKNPRWKHQDGVYRRPALLAGKILADYDEH